MTKSFKGIINVVANQCVGHGRLHVNDTTVAELDGMHTQVGKFSLCVKGSASVRDGSGNATADYPGDLPWSFTGGTIQRVIVDVPGEAYADIELEAMGMLSRD